MSKKTVALVVFLILSPVIIYFLWPSDESRIRKLFREGARAVEAEKIDDVMAKVAFSYSDEHGLSYLLLKNSLQKVFDQMSGIRVEYEIKGISVREGTASAELDIRVIATRGQDTGYFVGDAARPLHVTFFLEKERATWLVSRTEGIPSGF